MKKHGKKIMEHLMGPTGSIIAHIVIVFALVKLVFFAAPTKDNAVEAVIMEIEEAELDDIKEELKKLEDVEVVDAVTPPDVSLETDVPPEEVDDFESEQPDVEFEALDVLDSVKSPLVMSGLYKGRSDAGRKGALGAHAGKWGEHTERAVLRALEWLKSNQNEDGSWANEVRTAAGNTKLKEQVGMTGLGLLTFLAHGETPTSEQYGATVEKAIRYLVDTLQDDGMWDSKGPKGWKSGICGANYVYGHAIGTYAISEAYGLTQIPALKGAMEKSVKVIIDGQQSGGGWDYNFKKNPRRDTSVSGWQIQALKAAYIAQADVPGLKKALDKSIIDLKKSQNANGKFAYSNNPDEGSIGCSGIGVLCMQLLGYADDDACRLGIEYLNEKATEVDWNDVKGSHELYGWYYITQAKFHHGKNWSAWNTKFAKAFTRAQNDDGSWTAPGEESKRGKVYGTTFAALTLQVYYRLLPTYQQKAVAEVEIVEDDEDEDLIQVI